MFLLHFPVHLRFISPLDLKKKSEKESKDQVSTEKNVNSLNKVSHLMFVYSAEPGCRSFLLCSLTINFCICAQIFNGVSRAVFMFLIIRPAGAVSNLELHSCVRIDRMVFIS